MRGSVGALPRPAIYAIKKPKGLGGEYQFAGAAADYGFGSAFAVDVVGGAAQLLSLIWLTIVKRVVALRSGNFS
jgi:hypothetical protein